MTEPTAAAGDHPPAPWRQAAAEVADVLSAIDSGAYPPIAEAFADLHSRWFASGQGRSGFVASMVAMRLMHIGRESHVLGEATCPSVRHSDRIVFISGSGETEVTLRYAAIAKAEGAFLIAVTGRPESRLAKIANLPLIIPDGPTSQLGGNLFEQSALLMLDSVITQVAAATLTDPAAELHYRHTNMQ